jgi:hydrogenase maturation protease
LRLILAIGQRMRGDDGAGLAAVTRWQSMFPARTENSEVQVELLELPGLELLNYLEAAELVLIVDAVQSGAAPGSLHLLKEKDVARFGQGSDSAHGWGVAETLGLGRQLQPDKMPAWVEILGIEAGDVAMGDGLSPEVAGVMDQAALMIEECVTTARCVRRAG